MPRPTGLHNVDFQEADVFDLLAGYAAAHRQYSLVVLDPPAFTKSRKNLDAATSAIRKSTCARCGCWVRAEFW